MTTETRVRVLEAGHRVLTEQQAEIVITMAEGKECMRDIIRESVQAALPHTMPTAEQLRWVDAAIKREAQTYAFRQAVIDKTITALVWAALAGLGTVLWALAKEYAQAHGWKP